MIQAPDLANVDEPPAAEEFSGQETLPLRCPRWLGLLVGLFFVTFGLGHALPGMVATSHSKTPALVWGSTLVWTLASSGYVAAGLGLWRGGAPFAPWRLLAATAAAASLLLLLLAQESALWPIGAIDLICLATIRKPFAFVAPRPRWSWRVTWAALYAAWFFVTGVTLLRPWHQNWGATTEEVSRIMIGDDRAPSRRHFINHVVSVNAPPERVWPWLIQLGEDRAGFYSYDFLERLAGTGIHNVYEIRPEWQSRKVSDFVRSCPPDWLGGRWKDLTGWKVGAVEPNRLLYLELWGPMWIELAGDGKSRLGVRSHIGDVPFWAAPIEVYLFEPIHFTMEQKMLRTIRDLAERSSSTK